MSRILFLELLVIIFWFLLHDFIAFSVPNIQIDLCDVNDSNCCICAICAYIVIFNRFV